MTLMPRTSTSHTTTAAIISNENMAAITGKSILGRNPGSLRPVIFFFRKNIYPDSIKPMNMTNPKKYKIGLYE